MLKMKQFDDEKAPSQSVGSVIVYDTKEEKSLVRKVDLW
jgi:nitrogen fixation-related uncharacterized protein